MISDLGLFVQTSPYRLGLYKKDISRTSVRYFSIQTSRSVKKKLGSLSFTFAGTANGKTDFSWHNFSSWPEMKDIAQAYQSVSSLSVYPLEFLIILSLPVKASGISNIRVGVVYKAKHEVCAQVLAFSSLLRRASLSIYK